MIVRIWHGRTKKTDAPAYRDYVSVSGIPGYLATPGNLGAQIWQRDEGDITHIWTVSWWPDMETVRKFAGEPVERALYWPEDKNFLLEFEENVFHAECTDFPAKR